MQKYIPTTYLKIIIPIVFLVILLGVIFWPKSPQLQPKINQISSSSLAVVNLTNFPTDQKKFEGFERNEFGNYVPTKTTNSTQSGNFADSSIISSNDTNVNLGNNSSLSTTQNNPNQTGNSSSQIVNPAIVDTSKNTKLSDGGDVTADVGKIVQDFFKNNPIPSLNLPKTSPTNPLTDPIFKELSPTELPSAKLNGSTFVDTNAGVCGIRGLVSFASFGYQVKIIKNSQLTQEQNSHLNEFANGQAGINKNGNNVDKIFRDTCEDKNIEFGTDLGTIGTKFGNARLFVIQNQEYLGIVPVNDSWAMVTGAISDGDAILGACGFDNLVNLDENADMNNLDNSVADNLDKCIDQNTPQVDTEIVKNKINEILNLIN